MRIAILAVGTRGDVEPYLALALALKARNHTVSFFAGKNFHDFIVSHGITPAPATGDIAAIMNSPLGQAWVRVGNHPVRGFHALRRLVNATAQPLLSESFAACRQCDLIISGFVTDVYAHTFGEVLQKPVISIRLQPSMLATASAQASLRPLIRSRDSALNFWFGKFFIEPGLWKIYGEPINAFRRDALGIEPTTGEKMLKFWQRAPVLHAYSQAVVPHPSDWPKNTQTVGNFFLVPTEKTLSPPLSEFLQKDPAPVVISFGSMPAEEPEKLTHMLLAAVEKAGVRAVIVSGWGNLGRQTLPPSVLQVSEAPFPLLLPRSLGLVHHGGAGTTAAGFRAGIPMLVVSHLGDQPFWGRRVFELGAGPQPIRRDRLSADVLANHLIQLRQTPAFAKGSQTIQLRMEKEQGLAKAVELIETAI